MTKPNITMGEIVEGGCDAQSRFFSAQPGFDASFQWPGDERYKEGADLTRGSIQAVLAYLLTTANITEAQLIALARGEAKVVTTVFESAGTYDLMQQQIETGRMRAAEIAALKARP